MIVAAQLYTVRERLQDRDRLTEALRRLREIGYTAVEIAGVAPALAASLDEDLKAAGLVACAAHVPLEDLGHDQRSDAALVRRWGCDYVVVPSLPVRYHSAAGFGRFGHEAETISTALRPFGLSLAYHNHAFELERFDDRTGLEILFASAAPNALQAELDTYWLQYAGADPVEWIQRLAGRLPLVHLKDMAMVEGRPVQTEIGNGELDWPAILNACRAAGTRWLVVEQDECQGDPLESLAISYHHLAKMN